VAEGKLLTCPGETNDYDMVEDSIRADCKQFDVLEVAHDPYQAQQFVNHLAPEGITMVEVPQIAKHLSEPMKELEAAVFDGRFHFDGPILTSAISNVVCHRDKNDKSLPDQRKIRKQNRSGDGASHRTESFDGDGR
jgi:phage terminase large subunit-like protein